LHQALKTSYYKHDVHQNWQYFEKNATEIKSESLIFDMYKTFEKTISIFKCSCRPYIKAKKLQLKQIL
jgi:hypothetical protein